MPVLFTRVRLLWHDEVKEARPEVLRMSKRHDNQCDGIGTTADHRKDINIRVRQPADQ